MSNRFTHHDEDLSRLPEGFERIGYDDDTRRYTFRDANGNLYHGEPGSEYGILTPITSAISSIEQSRPSAFANSPVRRSTLPAGPGNDVPRTFQDILPPELITSSSMSNTSGQATSKSSGDQIVNLVRKSTLPKMQGIVHSLRRSVTSMRRSRLPSVNAPGSDGKSPNLFRRMSKLSTSSTAGSHLTPSVSSDTEYSHRSVMPVHPLSHS
ncbi:hypothetical protein CVT25_002300 [Psilocybe cyanescens]|uniref:Carbohydrate-binding module family 50 protein n=1 Tax=Psilocybe cyanescens TaxID=93625 RepID=A0A409WKL5_PSICY|nr:hypothetical protein CVT25_002300 [Psilocybe cyanescens]